ncbi:conserved hypothetical protein [Leishmania infantum JPCM5]|uniref:Uncharacterized protein n=2 Tax=Leishmania infantum TaxID=5671 RepID=A4HXS5_LEIIN|nr:conserved hypothetical protein [Leishmania infantum JPCM5]CAC9480165.1 hypothetical_protein_-_conserved [Leishmania infantum]CAM67103.1 conserved hypothetical protein [Leishmania infantum JPCM5]SUZ40974.1 hypothetical_protein_-_conserved [Leishmania infantum]|eukprot:XP_001464866.1 conserved hypothetical protein [Leishmania infantum JPCM5]
MPPLTLEQVLARSMRLPRQRTQQQASRLYKRHESAELGGSPGWAPSTATGSSPVDSGAPRSSRIAALMGSRHAGKHGGAGCSGVSETVANKAKLNFFELMEREDAQRRASRLSIHSSGHLVRNSADLTTYLTTAQRTGDWEGGLRAFAEATALPAVAAMLPASEATATSAASTAGTSTTSTSLPPAPSRSGINPNEVQITAVLDMCANAEKWDLVEKIGVFFAPAYPDTFSRAVELLARRMPSDSSAGEGGWRSAFAYLTTRCPLPAAEITVEAFNVCLRGCEAALDWRGAMEVVRAMGPNPLQGWRAADEEEDEAGCAEAAASLGCPVTASDPTEADTVSSSPPTASASPARSMSTPPSPNVVSYATLIATLEQAGKESLASAVLNRLPAVEKEEITASYAALIMVWSNQILHKQRRRF